MKASKIQVSDIRSIGVGGSITVELPNYLACVSAKNTVGYVKKAYPRADGLINSQIKQLVFPFIQAITFD